MTSAQTSPLLPNNNNSKEDTKDIIALDQIQIEDDDGTTQTTPEGNEMGRVNVNTSNLSNAELLHRERMKPEQHAKDGNSGSPHSQRWYQTVVFAVSFYMATSIVMVIVNKAVLNAVSLPITFLWLQIVVAVALIYGCHFAGLWKLPSKLDPVVVRGLLPLVSINVIGLTFNTLCLTFVDASLYQVARSLILPLTVAFSWIVLKKPSSMAVIAACSVVVSGFLVGTLLEDKELKISFWGIAFGVFSSFTTAMHAVVISKSLDVVNGSLSDLVFYNNLLSLVGLLPVVVFSGELGGLGAVLASDNLKTFLWGTLITGFFGFLINVAGFLQIKVTSPITHMISSAMRGVIQTVLAVWFFGDVITAQRLIGITLILAGSSYYTWVRAIETEQEKSSRV